MRAVVFLVALMFVVLISGCTIPGTGVNIPWPFGPQVVEYKHDVVIIKSLTAIPATVSPGQQTRLVAYVQNLGKESVKGISVELYDYCSTVFPKSDIAIACPDNKISNTECEIDLLPNEVKEIDWTLKADPNIKMITTCPPDGMKVQAKYHYKTTSLTTVTFINYQEMQKRIEEGTFQPIESYIVAGYGPVKPILTVEDQQPIPAQNDVGTTVIALQIENKGMGFLENNKIPTDKITIDFKNLKPKTTGECNLPPKEDVVLIQKKSAKLLCEVEKSGIPIPEETTDHMEVTIEYNYEFRSSVKVTVKPKM